MRYIIKFSLLFSTLFPMTAAIQAQIGSSNSVKIRFAPAETLNGITWSSSVLLTESGLFLERLAPNTSAEVWVQSQPMAAGMSWRPPTSVMVRVEVESGPDDFTYLHSYFRYSCDKVHWSTWYNLSSAKAQPKDIAFAYEGWLSVPRVARKEYAALSQEWWKTNPVWSSDEHELCIWIAKRNPDFFSSEFPFIGYIQVRIEGETRGMSLKSLRINTSSSVSGLMSVKKGQVRSTTDEKWFFDLSKMEK
jgi:hypothetical protein